MRPHDLPSIKVLARKNPHGKFIKFLGGCRCWRCVKCEKDYMAALELRHKTEGRNNLVPVDRVRNFLLEMQSRGIGYMTIAKHVKVGKTKLAELLWPPPDGAPQWIRAQKERKVLSYVPTLDTLPKMYPVPAGETQAKVKQLLLWGIPRMIIAKDTCGTIHGLQHVIKGNKAVVLVKTAVRVRDYHAKIEAIRVAWVFSGRTIPARHYVYWKKRKNGKRDVDVRHLELRPFHVGYDYHYRYPAEMKAAIRVERQLKAAYRKKAKEDGGNQTEDEKQNERPSQPSVRNPGGAAGYGKANGTRARAHHRVGRPNHHQRGRPRAQGAGNTRGNHGRELLRGCKADERAACPDW